MIEDGNHSREMEALRERLREAEETLDAIRNGEVDAVVVAGDGGVPQVYTLETADQTYRILVEEMREGALTLSVDGTVLYSNRRFAELAGTTTSAIVGGPLSRYVPSKDAARLDAAAAQSGKGSSICSLRMVRWFRFISPLPGLVETNGRPIRFAA